MEELSTVQKRNRLNQVHRDGGEGPGGAHHEYVITRSKDPLLEDLYGPEILRVKFQKGPRNEPGSVTGVLDVDLLEIVRDRLRAFQSGPFACRENACALTHLEEALLWMNKRVEDRAERGVLGTNNK